MRIALVAEDYYPQVGGVPEHVHHLALELAGRGHEPTVVTARMPGAGRDPPFVRRVGRSRVIYANGGVARITTGWRLVDRLATVFREQSVDLVHVHGGLSPVLGLAAPRAAWKVGLPVVATFHTWFPRSIGYAVFRGPLQRLLDRHAAAIAVSGAAVDAMSRYFRAPWEIIPNGIDVGTFNPGPHRAAPEPRGPLRLLFLGRLEPRNGLDTLLDAMPGIVARRPRVELAVAGDGPWRLRYERRARGLPVRFLGAVRTERPELYRWGDLYVCPTRRASFGVTLLEAMASGTPALVSDLPAFREVAGSHATFVPPLEADAWAEAIARLGADGSRWLGLSAAARAAALPYAWPRVTDRLLEVYARVLGRGSPALAA